MKLFAPKYYRDFKCIADRCEHCCCTGWEIDIDEATLKRYQGLKGGYGETVKGSIDMEDMPHFTLKEGDRCPHLDDRGLCRIILHLGEGYLCDICREHPRFYNYTEVAEVGIGMSCPEAARVILSSPDYDKLEEIGEVAAEGYDLLFDARKERESIYKMLEGEYNTALEKIHSTYGIEMGEDALWQQRLLGLEYLEESHKALFGCYSSKARPQGKDLYLKRFLAYLIYRHCTEAEDREDFGARLGFCLFCQRLLCSLIVCKEAETLEEIADLARIISEEIEYSDDNTYDLTYESYET